MPLARTTASAQQRLGLQRKLIRLSVCAPYNILNRHLLHTLCFPTTPSSASARRLRVTKRGHTSPQPQSLCSPSLISFTFSTADRVQESTLFSQNVRHFSQNSRHSSVGDSTAAASNKSADSDSPNAGVGGGLIGDHSDHFLDTLLHPQTSSSRLDSHRHNRDMSATNGTLSENIDSSTPYPQGLSVNEAIHGWGKTSAARTVDELERLVDNFKSKKATALTKLSILKANPDTKPQVLEEQLWYIIRMFGPFLNSSDLRTAAASASHCGSAALVFTLLHEAQCNGIHIQQTTWNACLLCILKASAALQPLGPDTYPVHPYRLLTNGNSSGTSKSQAIQALRMLYNSIQAEERERHAPELQFATEHDAVLSQVITKSAENFGERVRDSRPFPTQNLHVLSSCLATMVASGCPPDERTFNHVMSGVSRVLSCLSDTSISAEIGVIAAKAKRTKARNDMADIDVLAKCKQLALFTVVLSKEHSVRPSRFVFLTCLHACAGDREATLFVWNTLLTLGSEPCQLCYEFVIDVASSSERDELASTMLQSFDRIERTNKAVSLLTNYPHRLMSLVAKEEVRSLVTTQTVSVAILSLLSATTAFHESALRMLGAHIRAIRYDQEVVDAAQLSVLKLAQRALPDKLLTALPNSGLYAGSHLSSVLYATESPLEIFGTTDRHAFLACLKNLYRVGRCIYGTHRPSQLENRYLAELSLTCGWEKWAAKLYPLLQLQDLDASTLSVGLRPLSEKEKTYLSTLESRARVPTKTLVENGASVSIIRLPRLTMRSTLRASFEKGAISTCFVIDPEWNHDELKGMLSCVKSKARNLAFLSVGSRESDSCLLSDECHNVHEISPRALQAVLDIARSSSSPLALVVKSLKHKKGH